MNKSSDKLNNSHFIYRVKPCNINKAMKALSGIGVNNAQVIEGFLAIPFAKTNQEHVVLNNQLARFESIYSNLIEV